MGDHRIVVQLPHCSHPVCLPVLLRLWRGKGTASPAFLATDMVSILAQSFPYRNIQSLARIACKSDRFDYELCSNTTEVDRETVGPVC